MRVLLLGEVSTVVAVLSMSGGLEGRSVDISRAALAEWLFGALNETILGGELAPG
jgi:hypothetical protein